MYRFPLLILWIRLVATSLGCDTGVAFTNQSLNLYGSSLANADVAVLRSYVAEDLNGCLNDCCTEKYGSCSVASFKRNATGPNCQLFNCLPVQKCKFASSSNTDSFSFSSSTLPKIVVPSSGHASGNNSSTSTTATPTSTVEEPIASKNDNTTVKPRKGVEGDIFERSRVKPRKGVSLEEGGSVKSKVKPRKGVGPQPDVSQSTNDTSVTAPPFGRNESRPSLNQKVNQNVEADDLTSALEKVFEDDVRDRSLVTSSEVLVAETSTMAIRPSSSLGSEVRSASIPTSLTTLLQPSSSAGESTTPGLLPSLTTSRLAATSRVATSSARTPYLQTGAVRATGVFDHTPTPSSPTILEHSRLIFHEVSGESNFRESESERKYKSSMHLVLSLVFGLLILVSVLGVVAKRIYDSWMRRHYRRMDFLIDGMYNGYG